MSRMSAFTFALYTGINLALVFIGRGSFGQLLAVICTCWIALVSACIGAIIHLVGHIGGGASPTHRRLALRATAFGLLASGCLVSYPIGLLVNRYDVEQAKNFCDRVRSELERYRSETGRYPKRLSEVSDSGRLPRLLQGTEFYQSDGSEYSFQFSDPSEMLAGFAFDSRSEVWDEWD